MELLPSEKNKSMGHLDDHLYWRESERTSSKGTRTYWRCIFFQAGPDGQTSSKCPGKHFGLVLISFAHHKNVIFSGRAVTFDGGANETTSHNHHGDKDRVERKRMQGRIQEEAMKSKEAPRSIIAKAIQEVPEEARPLIRRSLFGRNIRNIRHEAKLEPANPKTLKELVVSLIVYHPLIHLRPLFSYFCTSGLRPNESPPNKLILIRSWSPKGIASKSFTNKHCTGFRVGRVECFWSWFTF